MLVATLIAANATSHSAAMKQDDMDAAARMLVAAGLLVQSTAWLDEGRAADIFVAGSAGEDAVDIKATAVSALAAMAGSFDIAVQTLAQREKRLFLSDMDSTMIGQECIDELADYAGVGDEIAAITERAMRGELDFAASLRERVAKLAGLDEAVIAQCLAERIAANPGAKTLVATLRARNVHCMLVSGGFHHFADVVGVKLGFHAVHANRLAVADGHLTGHLVPPIFGAQSKADALSAAAAAHNIPLAHSLAVGDGANDLPMLAAAGLSIGYHPKPVVNDAVDFAIRHNDLSAILYAMGIKRAEWQIIS